jgi:hemoglobin
MQRTLLICSLLFAACAGSNQKVKPAQKPLYDRLGGKDAIVAVVDNFVGRLAKDARINARFSNSDIPHLKLMLVEQICEAAGGPCKYSGKDMKTAHKGQNVTDDEFNALVEDLKGTLDEFKVPAPEQKDLLGALGPMKPDIVGQ